MGLNDEKCVLTLWIYNFQVHILRQADKICLGWFTNEDLNEQINANYLLFRYYHPTEKYDICFAFDNSMIHKAQSPDGRAWAKAHHRSTCTYKYNDLKTGLPVMFDELMPISLVLKAFDHCLRFMQRSGLFGPVLECAVKKYKSHRHLSPTIRLDEIASEFAEKKA